MNIPPFSDQLRAQRARLCLNRQACAKLLDVHWRTVANWEQGRKCPTGIWADTVLSLLASKQPS